MMSMQSFLTGDIQQLVDKALTLDSEKQNHFLLLMSSLLDCYLKQEFRVLGCNMGGVRPRRLVESRYLASAKIRTTT
jgi:hypothetical protein